MVVPRRDWSVWLVEALARWVCRLSIDRGSVQSFVHGRLGDCFFASRIFADNEALFDGCVSRIFIV